MEAGTAMLNPSDLMTLTELGAPPSLAKHDSLPPEISPSLLRSSKVTDKARECENKLRGTITKVDKG